MRLITFLVAQTYWLTIWKTRKVTLLQCRDVQVYIVLMYLRCVVLFLPTGTKMHYTKIKRKGTKYILLRKQIWFRNHRSGPPSVGIAEVNGNLIRRWAEYCRIAGLLKNCNSAMRRFGWRMPPLKTNTCLSPELKIGSVAAELNHRPYICGSLYYNAPQRVPHACFIIKF